MSEWNREIFDIEDTSAATLQASAAGAKAFRDAVSGVSVHWGLYTVLGKNEWSLYLDKMEHEAYFKTLMPKFNPARFCAEEWADLMLEARQRFFMMTAKHHDGFCMWDTALSDKKVTNTPLGRDLCAEIATAMQERGIHVHWYYSLLDWTHPAYHSREKWHEYRDYLHAHLRELLTGYGPIHGVLFDGYWPRTAFDENDAPVFKEQGLYRLAEVYDLIHALQPDAMVTNNHHAPILKGEDYQVLELDVPGENLSKSYMTTEPVNGIPQGAWWFLGGGWGYQPARHTVRPVEDVMDKMRKTRARDGTLIINAAPRSFGDIHPDEAWTLRRIGERMREEGL